MYMIEGGGLKEETEAPGHDFSSGPWFYQHYNNEKKLVCKLISVKKMLGNSSIKEYLEYWKYKCTIYMNNCKDLKELAGKDFCIILYVWWYIFLKDQLTTLF